MERPTFKRAHPVQVTMRLCDGLPSLRERPAWPVLNARKHAAEHGESYPAEWVDPRSTAVTFDGWARPLPLACAKDFGNAQAETWLLRVGWRQRGPIELDAIPGDVVLDSANVARAA